MKLLLIVTGLNFLLLNCHRSVSTVSSNTLNEKPSFTQIDSLRPPGNSVLHVLGKGESLADTISMEEVRRTLKKKNPSTRTYSTGDNSFEAVKDTTEL
ncbi:hypothetical protein [Spirosoma sp.]|uniref:hypothetical protein n=1 Tax=Spirosoma sp. TaxID=1899569 RepID=UPI00261C3C65|nr:hypothetical protein [Spirosoma sp.]MCX6214461.1 hypothetical protein [Spirosoma sp.]